MNWTIIWHPKAAKYVEGLPNMVAQRVLKKFDEIIKEPFRYLEHFAGEPYKLRVGEYRALIEADFEKRILKIQVFDKRERVY